MKKRRLIPQADDEGSRKKQKIEQPAAKNTINIVGLQPFDSTLLPAEIIRHMLAQINEEHVRLHMRLVCKTWFEWISFTNFSFGVVRSHEIPRIATILSRYTKPIGLTIKKSQLLSGDELGPLWTLTNLTSLSINNLISEISGDVTQLTNLYSLDINYPRKMEDIQALTKLTQLKVLEFDVGTELPNLEALTFHNFDVDYISTCSEVLSRLTELTITNVCAPQVPMSLLKMLIENAPVLKRLKTKFPEDFMGVTNRVIKDLNFTALESLETDIMFDPDFLPCDTLTRLIAGEMASPSAHKFTSRLTNLKELQILQPSLEAINSLVNLPKLESLALTEDFQNGSRVLQILPSPLRLTNLEIMFQNGTKKQVEELTSLTNLKALKFTSNGNQQLDLSFFSKLSNLTLLSVICDQGTTTSLDWSTAMTGLQKLHLAMPGKSETNIMKNISVTNLTRLTYLFCRSVAHAFDLRGLTNLEELMLSNIKDQIETTGLETLKNLTNIVMIHPMPAKQWKTFIQLTSLRSMYIEYEGKDAEKKFDELTALKHLTSFMCMQSTWTGRNLTRLTSLQSITFGTRKAIAGQEYSDWLKDNMPLLYECTYFQEFMSQFSALWGK